MFDCMEYIVSHGHEEVVMRYDKKTGLRVIIAIHNTARGPALGGTRLWHYDTFQDALIDVLRLSEGMTYKAAVAGLALGGGKAVIMADGKEDDPDIRAARFEVFGKFVNDLGGRYITAEDVGTKTSDMHYVRMHTKNVTGMDLDEGGSGDPSPVTALGCFHGIRALVKDVLEKPDLKGVKVAIQGLGKVGIFLAKDLLEAGAIVVGSDVFPEPIAEAKKLGIKIIEPDDIYGVECDIFSPNALGAIINDETIPKFKCKIVAGAANNQLAEPRHGQRLHDRGIAYAVDYVINAGGLINVSQELESHDGVPPLEKAARIYDTLMKIQKLSREKGITPAEAAQQMAYEAIENP